MAQEIIVRSKFLIDSVKLGESINYTMAAKYPSKLTILFPDSTFAFTPFEFQKKIYSTTQTINGISYDSVIYTLQTYEVDSLQFLRLPIFISNRADCTLYYSNTDTVFFKHLVKTIPDSLAVNNLPLKANTNYVNVKWELNTILFAIIVGALLLAAVIVWIVFGKRIRKYFAMKKLMRKHQEFVNRFGKSLEQLNAEFQPERAEQVVVIWKKYLEELLSIPYTKYTSKEIREREQNEELGNTLKNIDRMIYARLGEDKSSFANLLQYGEQKFQQRMEEVKNG